MKELFCVPSSIARLREHSSRRRKEIVEQYFSLSSPPEKPPFLDADITVSHLKRSAMELEDYDTPTMKDREERFLRYYSYTRGHLADYPLDGSGGALTEVCIGVMGEVLHVAPNLQVAAGFFSSMVASVDDYLDREGSFDDLGERLFYISHAYRDLMDLALEGEVACGTIGREELHEIRCRLFKVTRTLVRSESTNDPDRYLYEKSCGDRVIDVLTPLSPDDEARKERCREMGRLVGEAGQLLDDIMDYEYDKGEGKKNYIIMSRSDMTSALDETEERIENARRLAAELQSRSMVWIVDGLDDIVHILRIHHKRNRGITSSLLHLSSHLKHLMPECSRANQFLVWF
ncbi:MAG: class 1 isoprenoid biosynthesis enzyme [Thermodesulfobacteriota bacterium]